jgi:citrate synthase
MESKGLLTYRGYPMQDLAANSSFLETAYLLIWGELPSRDQLAEFEHAVQMHRRVSFRVRDMMKCFPASGHPMDALQSSALPWGCSIRAGRSTTRSTSMTRWCG